MWGKSHVYSGYYSKDIKRAVTAEANNGINSNVLSKGVGVKSASGAQ